MPKVSGVVCTYNEAENIIPLIKNLKDCDEVVITDGHSTDKTVEIAEKMGARVYLRKDKFDIVSKKDIKDFVKIFRYKPVFTVGMKLRNMADIRNKAVKLSENDWIYFPDADERVKWKLNGIKPLLDNTDKIECEIIESEMFKHDVVKLYDRRNCYWAGRIHEIVTGGNKKVIHVTDMKITHHQKPKDRSYALPYLEYAVLKENSVRSRFYLGREYYHHKKYQKAISIFNQYFPDAEISDEKAEGYYLAALCWWFLGRKDSALKYCQRAVEMYPSVDKFRQLIKTMSGDRTSLSWLVKL